MRSKHAQHHRYMLLVIAASMAVIVSAWFIWFFPRAAADESGERSFRGFGRDVLKSFSIFASQNEPKKSEVDIDDLRARVFGDKIER